MLKPSSSGGFEPYFIAYDYRSYDPDVEDIKQRTYVLLNIEASFHVRTYPGGTVDGRRLKEILTQVRRWCQDAKSRHPVKTLWYMMILLMEDSDGGLTREDMIGLLTTHEIRERIPPHLQRTHGDFGYRYTLSRSFDEVMAILLERNCIQTDNRQYRLTSAGIDELRSRMQDIQSSRLDVAAYGTVDRIELLRRLMVVS